MNTYTKKHSIRPCERERDFTMTIMRKILWLIETIIYIVLVDHETINHSKTNNTQHQLHKLYRIWKREEKKITHDLFLDFFPGYRLALCIAYVFVHDWHKVSKGNSSGGLYGCCCQFRIVLLWDLDYG